MVRNNTNFLRNSIFITGIHRSGTSWIGNMLALGGNHKIFDEEIFSISPSGTPIKVMYEYVCEENEANYINWINKVAYSNNRFSFRQKMKKAKSLRVFSSIIKWKLHSIALNLFYKNNPTIFIEPMGLISAEWFARKFNTKMLVIIRHPASFVSSIKRWETRGKGRPDHSNFSLFLNQYELMDKLLGDYKKDMENSLSNGDDLIARNIIVWNMMYSIVKYYQENHSDWIFIRHEDLAKDPIRGFRKLYKKLEIDFDDFHKQAIIKHCLNSNPSEAPTNNPGLIKRNSLATITNWKNRLSDEEIYRIRNGTWDVSKHWYSESDW